MSHANREFWNSVGQAGADTTHSVDLFAVCRAGPSPGQYRENGAFSRQTVFI